MWWWMYTGCGPAAPVPTHGALDAVREAVVSADQPRIETSVTPFRQAENGLGGVDVARWASTRRAATLLARARVPSERHELYAALVVSCRSCHSADKAPRTPVTGHGLAFAALDEGMAFVDPRRLEMASEALGVAPDLTNIQGHVMARARAASIATQDVVRIKALRDVYDTCVRCHGTVMPVPFSSKKNEAHPSDPGPRP